MTLVTMTLAVPTGTVGDPEAPAVGSLEWTPHARRVEDDRVVLPDTFTVTLWPSPVTVEVEPGPWRVREVTPAGITRWVIVPDVAPPGVGYEDLPSVNRFTLAPDAVPPAAWTVALGDNSITDAEIAAALGGA